VTLDGRHRRIARQHAAAIAGVEAHVLVERIATDGNTLRTCADFTYTWVDMRPTDEPIVDTKRVPTSVRLYVVATTLLVVLIAVARVVSSDDCRAQEMAHGSPRA
jgi:hypothetical protein